MKYVKLMIGSLLLALTFNFLLIPNGFVPFGSDGISFIFNNLIDIPTSFILLFINIVIILISLFINPKNSYKYLLPSLLIPTFMYITSYLNIPIDLPETVLKMVISSVFITVAYSLIYQSGYKAGTIYLLEEDLGDITKIYTKVYSILIDIFIVIIFMFQRDFQSSVYSLFIILISRYLINKARYNINDSKMFYVITSKEKEVKHFIMSTLGYELTELDVKGGFTQQRRSILLSVISAKDYYKLKSGIMKIDHKAFIAITDTYDVINRKAF
jgi:uncharacterized membrane-anchored protein YitT (DUF2179 family)